MINDFMYQYNIKTNREMGGILGVVEGSIRKWRGGVKTPKYIEILLKNEVKIRKALEAGTLEECKDILRGG